ncbi:MAG: hypothetical protein AB7G47_01595 [Mycolicibacterium sp.]|uniref:hypothetical protein n=1 Tax=Mycolicibacterium sp. TaxID=2320850 RepID=UPI003D1104F7
MCYPERCSKCGKTGWAGCGQHIDDVMKRVPPGQRCICGEVPEDDRHDFSPRTVSNVLRRFA